MQSYDIRKKFLDFFVQRGHRLYPSSSLVPHNDPTVLLTTAGMQQFITYFTGQEKAPTPRATSVQKCFRTQDLEEVGDPTHLTLFEMLGNFSFGDYFKKEAIEFAWKFLTNTLNIPPERLWVTIFEGDENAPEDLEAKEYWIRAGVPEDKIFGLPKSENWWGPPGETGPCGPCSEVYFDYGEELSLGDPQEDPKYGPGGAEGDPRFIEIWNLVFNQYEQLKDRSLVPLAKPGVDTGMGLERTTAVMQGVRSVYETDLYAPIFDRVQQFTDARLGASAVIDRTLYILADHSRGIAFLIADGVRPGNQRRDYVLRRIIRRAAREAYARLGMNAEQLASLVEVVVDYMGEHYPELEAARKDIRRVVKGEAERFIEIYDEGVQLLEAEIAKLPGKIFPGEAAFELHDTHGFPVEVTRDVLSEKGLELDETAFEAAMQSQRIRAREAQKGYERVVSAFRELDIKSRFVGYEREQVETQILALDQVPGSPQERYLVLKENPFYATGGGQIADTGWITGDSGELDVEDVIPAGDYQVIRARVKQGTVKAGGSVTVSVNRVQRQQTEANHTATHILHWALRAVLGKDVVQGGSYVGPDRLRFDYRHAGKVTDEDIKRVQELVLLKITENQPVRYYITTLNEAREMGAMMLFGEKYGELVRVVEVDGFSRELCGGTHVRGSAEIGAFKILSNKKHGADLWRVEAVTGREALYYLLRASEASERASSALRTDIERLPEAVAELQEEAKQARETLREQTLKAGLQALSELVQNAKAVDGVKIVDGQVTASDIAGLRQLTDDVKNRIGEPAAVVLAAELNGKAVIVANLHPEVSRKIKAGDLVKEISRVLGGGGGGGTSMAQAGGGDPALIPQALARAEEVLREKLVGGVSG